MDILEIRVIYNVLQFMLLSWARYSLFKNELRLPLRWVIVIVGFVTTLTSCFWYFAGQQVIDFQLFRFLNILIVFGISCIIIKAPFAKHALSYLAIFTISVILDTLSLYVYVLFPNAAIPNLDTLVLLIMVLSLLYPTVRIIQKFNDHLSQIPNRRVWNYLCLCGFSVVLLCLTAEPDNTPTLSLLMSRVYLALAMIGTFSAAIWIQKGTLLAAQTQNALELANRQVSIQQSYYDNLLTQMEEIRHMRHDLRHHRAALTAIIKSGSKEDAAAYIKNWDFLDEVTPVTGSLVADSLLSFYCGRAKDLGFTLQWEFSLPALPGITNPDLCVLIGNLLENAIEAQANLPVQSRYVRICAKADREYFTLAVDNRFDGKLQKNQEQLLSRKEEPGHGIGLSSVRAVCKKYNGVLQIETQQDLFMAGIVIGL